MPDTINNKPIIQAPPATPDQAGTLQPRGPVQKQYILPALILLSLFGSGIVYLMVTKSNTPESKTVSVNDPTAKSKTFTMDGKALVFSVLSANQVKRYPRERLPNGSLKPIEFSRPTEIDGDIANVSIRGNQPLIVNGSAREVDINLRGANVIVVRSITAGTTPTSILTEGNVSIGENVGPGVEIRGREIHYGGNVDPSAQLREWPRPGEHRNRTGEKVPLIFH